MNRNELVGVIVLIFFTLLVLITPNNYLPNVNELTTFFVILLLFIIFKKWLK